VCADSASKGPMFQFTHSRDGGDKLRFGLGDLRRRRRRPGGSARAQQMRVEGVGVCVCVCVSVCSLCALCGTRVTDLTGMLAAMKGLLLSCHHQRQGRLRVSERGKVCLGRCPEWADVAKDKARPERQDKQRGDLSVVGAAAVTLFTAGCGMVSC
jgi:hypothetical protein